MPYARRYRKTRRKFRRKRRVKKKRGLSRTAKIAKKVCSRMLRKQTESYSFVQYIDQEYDRFSAEYGCLLATDGARDHQNNNLVNPVLWGPQTHLAAVQTGGQTPGERMGREIYFTGVQFRTVMRLPHDISAATITVRLCRIAEDSNWYHRVDQIFGNPTLPWIKQKDLPARVDVKLIAIRNFRLKHTTAGTGNVAREVILRKNFFLPVGKKVVYKEDPAAALECNKEDLMKGYYQIFLSADVVPYDTNSQDPPNKERFPQMNGTIDWCYRDA